MNEVHITYCVRMACVNTACERHRANVNPDSKLTKFGIFNNCKDFQRTILVPQANEVLYACDPKRNSDCEKTMCFRKDPTDIKDRCWLTRKKNTHSKIQRRVTNATGRKIRGFKFNVPAAGRNGANAMH